MLTFAYLHYLKNLLYANMLIENTQILQVDSLIWKIHGKLKLSGMASGPSFLHLLSPPPPPPPPLSLSLSLSVFIIIRLRQTTPFTYIQFWKEQRYANIDIVLPAVWWVTTFFPIIIPESSPNRDRSGWVDQHKQVKCILPILVENSHFFPPASEVSKGLFCWFVKLKCWLKHQTFINLASQNHQLYSMWYYWCT